MTAEKILFNSFGIETNNPIGLADALEDEYTKTTDTKRIKNAMIEFAQLHVKAALVASHNNMQLPEEDLEFTLNSYPLNNIK